MLGGLAAGIIATLLPTMLEMTYRPVNDAIGGDFPLGILLLSFLVKPVSNAVTLSSGGSGGTFAPSIKAGAMWGAALTLVIGALVPSIPPGLLAVACAAGVLAGTWKIPLTAAVLLTETTQNLSILLPLLLTCVLASFVVSRIPSAGSFNPIETKD
jgi:CIC family chloride channel protein